MSNVFVVDQEKRPLNPVHPGRARLLLSSGKAAIFKRYPFTIILKMSVDRPVLEPLRMKIDPGSKTTGLALVNDTTGEVVFAAELEHRGSGIRASLLDRRAIRRSRRQRHTRYRPPRWQNRRAKFCALALQDRPWLPPSLESRLANIMTWVQRLRNVAPIAAISQELVKFDMQIMQNPEVSGVQYQQGELQGFEVREYLLEKWGRACAYCGKKEVPLQVEHIQARVNGGSDRVSNLCLACEACNQAKGSQRIEVFLAKKPEVLKRIQGQAKAPLKDAAAVNATRWALYRRLQALGLPVEVGTGGRTKWNRTTRHLPKTHWLDAANVGASTPVVLLTQGVRALIIKATGHGTRQMCQTDKYGFPKQHRQRHKQYFGFQTGDMVNATIPKGKYAGIHKGRVTVRASGTFKIRVAQGYIPCNYRYCRALHRADGYVYGF